jgi:hypothetical protein
MAHAWLFSALWATLRDVALRIQLLRETSDWLENTGTSRTENPLFFDRTLHGLSKVS